MSQAARNHSMQLCKRAALASFLWLSSGGILSAELVDVTVTGLDRPGSNAQVSALQELPTSPLPTDQRVDFDEFELEAEETEETLAAQQPLTPQPLTPQPLAPQPLAPQPLAPQPLAPQAGAPQPEPVPPPAPQAAQQPPAAARPGTADLFGGRSLAASLGATAGGFSAAPTMMGDLFGGGVAVVHSSQPVTTRFFAEGSIIAGTGPADWQIAFSFDGGAPTDIFTQVGSGSDATGDGNIDTFSILEPVPPSGAPTSPGPGFVFDGGDATYTNSTAEPPVASNGQFADGEFWFIEYSYVSQGMNATGAPVIIAGPDVATRRVRIAENFSPEVRDRVFLSYNFFNNAYGGLGDISRYILGLERILYEDMVSLEARLPMAGTLSSRQQIDRPGDRNFELGNATLIGKTVLLRTPRLTWTSGMGVSLPLADDARLTRGNDQLLAIRNHSVHLLPFTGMVYKMNQRRFLQAYAQLDVVTKGNPVSANLAGGPLRRIGTFHDSTLLHLDVSSHRIIYQNQRAAVLRGIITNAELHYSTTLQESDRVEGEGVVITNLQRHFNVLNATFGTHLLLGEQLVVTPGVAVPLRDGLDRQFAIEGILQMNYLF